MDVRMEYTEGRGKLAEVWIDDHLLMVCDNISPAEKRLTPGVLEDVAFRYTTDEAVSWDEAIAANTMQLKQLVPESSWRYFGYGQIRSIMPTVIDFGLVEMSDPNWTTNESLIGQFVCMPIDRLELVTRQDEDYPGM
jgi:hypothetical protein